MCLKFFCMYSKQCRPWWDAAECGVSSRSTLFAEVCLSEYLWKKTVSFLFKYMHCIYLKYSSDQGLHCCSSSVHWSRSPLFATHPCCVISTSQKVVKLTCSVDYGSSWTSALLLFSFWDRYGGLNKYLTLVLWNPDISCLCKKCRSRSVGFWRSQLIWISTVCHKISEFIATIQIK